MAAGTKLAQNNLHRRQAVLPELVCIGAKQSGAKLIKILIRAIKSIRPIKVICILITS